MFSPSRAPSKPATAGAFAKLVTAGGLRCKRATRTRRPQALGHPPARRGRRRGRRCGCCSVVAVRIATTDMWFDSVHARRGVPDDARGADPAVLRLRASSPGSSSGLTILAVRRIRSPLDALAGRRHVPLDVPQVRTAVVASSSCSWSWSSRRSWSGGGRPRGWQTYLLWRHATPWHATDPLFHKDISFFVEVYPFHLMVVTLLSQALTYGLWIAVIGGYWYGALAAAAGAPEGHQRIHQADVAAVGRIPGAQGGQLLAVALRPHHLAAQGR